MNELFCIAPKRSEFGIWSFDDPARGVVGEPFVPDASEVIDAMTVHIPDAKNGFNLFFSEHEFKGWTLKLDRVGEEMGGNAYVHEPTGMTAWLCPCLLRYFSVPPQTIYASAKSRVANTKERIGVTL